MVGPGTGLAPFRAFICERLFSQSKSGDALGKQILYFGCRSKHQDYLYGNLLENWSDTGKIELFTAFSRDQVSSRVPETGGSTIVNTTFVYLPNNFNCALLHS